jgi:hypothetical protein
MASEKHTIAELFGFDESELLAIGQSTNPARKESRIYSTGRTAYRLDTWQQSRKELVLQIQHAPLRLSQLIKAKLTAEDLFDWKKNVGVFVEHHQPMSVVKISAIRCDEAEELSSRARFATKMERGLHTAKELLLPTGQVQLMQERSTGHAAVSLREVLYKWFAALASAEESYGLTYVDAHLDNFMLCDGGAWKLIDLESFQPLYLLFEEQSELDKTQRRQTPEVPAGYRSFLRAPESNARLTVQRFFTDLLHHKLQRYFVTSLQEVYLKAARENADLTTDTQEDLDRVEQFVAQFAEPRVRALGEGSVRADRFFREFPHEGLALLKGSEADMQPRYHQLDDHQPRAHQLVDQKASFGSSTTTKTSSKKSSLRFQALQALRNMHSGDAAKMHAGDAAKIVIIALCLIFLVTIALHEAKMLAVFSESYLEDGFCVSNKHLHPALQGHALAFYADTTMALVLAGVVQVGHAQFMLSEAALAPIAKNLISLAGHGCGHLFLALQASSTSGSTKVFENLTTYQRLLTLCGLFPVWYCFMRDKRRSTTTTCLFAMAHNILQVFFLPTRFFFTHVLMAVLLNSAVRWLSRDSLEKTKYYALESWLVDVPIVLASFFEALTCDSFLMRYGGHVWFDMVVPVMFLVYFLVLVVSGDSTDVAQQTARQTALHTVAGSKEQPKTEKDAAPTPAVEEPELVLQALRPVLLRRAASGEVAGGSQGLRRRPMAC